MSASLRGIVSLAVIASLAGACEQARQAPATVDTTTPPPPTPPDTALSPLPPPVPWDTAAGPLIVVRGDSGETAVVVLPQYTDSTLPVAHSFDSASVRGAALDLFGRTGAVGQARLESVDAFEPGGGACVGWPTVALAAARGAGATGSAGALGGWTVALARGRATALPLDSIEALPAADSARLAADVSRLASALPDTPSSSFRGLPFTVRTAYRFAPAPGVQAVVADAVRKLNQEANPLQEHTLLIAERDSTGAGSRFRAVYSERKSGSEERVESAEILAALAFGPARRTALLVSRIGDETTAYALIERAPSGQWRLRWTSAPGC